MMHFCNVCKPQTGEAAEPDISSFFNSTHSSSLLEPDVQLYHQQSWLFACFSFLFCLALQTSVVQLL